MTVDCLKYSLSRVIHAVAIHSARHHGLHVQVVSCWADYQCVLYEGNPRHAFWVHVALDPCSHCLNHQLIAHMQTKLQACPFCRLLQQPRRTPSDLVVLVPLPACLFLWSTPPSLPSLLLPQCRPGSGQIVHCSHVSLCKVVPETSIRDNCHFVFPPAELNDHWLWFTFPALSYSVGTCVAIYCEFLRSIHTVQDIHRCSCTGVVIFKHVVVGTPYIRRLSRLENSSSLSISDFSLLIAPFMFSTVIDIFLMSSLFLLALIKHLFHVGVGVLHWRWQLLVFFLESFSSLINLFTSSPDYFYVSFDCAKLISRKIQVRFQWLKLSILLYRFQNLCCHIRRNILGLCEMRWKNFGEITTEEGHKVFFSGKDDKHDHGVGFFVRKDIVNTVIGCRPVSRRLITIRLRAVPFNITTVQEYAPTSHYDDNKLEEIYDQLQNVIDQTPKKGILVVQGDWNAKVGRDACRNWRLACGLYGGSFEESFFASARAHQFHSFRSWISSQCLNDLRRLWTSHYETKYVKFKKEPEVTVQCNL